MPHVDNAANHRDLIKQDPKTHVRTVGDLNYYITVKYILPVWKADSRYRTAHELYAAKRDICLKTLGDLFSWPMVDIVTAFDLAWTQFYQEVVVPYEAKKARENGNVYVEEGVLEILPPIATAEAWPTWDGESQGE